MPAWTLNAQNKMKVTARDSRDYSTEAGVPAWTLNAQNKIMVTARDSRHYNTEAGVPAWTPLPRDESFQVLAD